MRRFFAFLFLLGLPIALAPACGSNSLAGKGGSCFQAIDCQNGLFCLGADGGAAGTCSDCTNCISVVPEAGGDGTMDAVGDSPTDNNVTDAPPPDTGPQDTGVVDTGPQDTGVVDTGTDAPPPTDAGAG